MSDSAPNAAIALASTDSDERKLPTLPPEILLKICADFIDNTYYDYIEKFVANNHNHVNRLKSCLRKRLSGEPLNIDDETQYAHIASAGDSGHELNSASSLAPIP